MAKINISQEAVTALRTTSSSLEKCDSSIMKEVSLLSAVFEENKSRLGPSSNKIKSLIEDVESLSKKSSELILSLCIRINDAASFRQDIIDNDLFAHLSTSSAGTGSLGGNGGSSGGKDVSGGSGSGAPKPYDDEELIPSQRTAAVKKAWALERERVMHGKGTRDWTVGQQVELIVHGRVKGFEGHHIKNVDKYPQYAGDPHDIQFVTYEEHLYGAHGGSFRNPTDGQYDPATDTTLDSGEVPEIVEIELTEKVDPEQAKSLSEWDDEFGYSPRSKYDERRKEYKDIPSNGKFGK